MTKDLWQYLKSTDKPIVLYGMGNGADKIINVLENYGVKFSGVFATDEFVRDKVFHGLKLTTYSNLKNQFGKMIVLLCFGSERPDVLENIRRISAEQELYAPDVPVFGGGLFTNDYYNRNTDDFNYIRSRLADEKSKQTFDNVINYKLSGKLEYLYECAVNQNDPYQNFLTLNDSECFTDLGAYNGDTVLEFVSRVKNYQSITAVEPDTKTFKKLTINTSNIKNINLINACASDFCGTKFFSMNGGRNSSVGGNKEIPSVTVDSLFPSATFIKMDIEGEEINAIRGAENTIKNHKPKMQIACYHRTDDLIAIPKEIDKIRKDYKIFLRHFPCVPAWDLNFYFI